METSKPNKRSLPKDKQEILDNILIAGLTAYREQEGTTNFPDEVFENIGRLIYQNLHVLKTVAELRARLRTLKDHIGRYHLAVKKNSQHSATPKQSYALKNLKFLTDYEMTENQGGNEDDFNTNFSEDSKDSMPQTQCDSIGTGLFTNPEVNSQLSNDCADVSENFSWSDRQIENRTLQDLKECDKSKTKEISNLKKTNSVKKESNIQLYNACEDIYGIILDSPEQIENGSLKDLKESQESQKKKISNFKTINLVKQEVNSQLSDDCEDVYEIFLQSNRQIENESIKHPKKNKELQKKEILNLKKTKAAAVATDISMLMAADIPEPDEPEKEKKEKMVETYSEGAIVYDAFKTLPDSKKATVYLRLRHAVSTFKRSLE